jgi:hypothetical protein
VLEAVARDRRAPPISKFAVSDLDKPSGRNPLVQLFCNSQEFEPPLLLDKAPDP